jgi:predicted amidohydrolase
VSDAGTSADRGEGGTPPLLVALGEYDIGWQDPAGSLARAEQLVQRARRAGARLVVLPEMATTGFTMDADRWAEPFGGADAERFKSIARVNGVWLIAGIAARTPDGAAHNVALVIAPSGELAGAYRKQRMFAYGGEHEAYVGGDGPMVVTMDGVRVSPFVCYDLRFPELFRAVARRVDLMVVIANWPAVRRPHWDLLLRARAVENLAHVVGVNRTGEGGGLVYDGGSAAWSPWGEPLPSISTDPTVVAVDPSAVTAVRKKYPFLDDMQ